MERTSSVRIHAARMPSLDGSNRGWVLPIALFGLMLLGSLSSLMNTKILSLAQVYRDYLVSSSTYEELRSHIATVRPPHGCTQQYASSQGRSRPWWVCVEPQPIFTTVPIVNHPVPAPDFNALLAHPKPCMWGRTRVAPNRYTSPVAPMNCSVTGTLSSSLAVIDNLEFDLVTIKSQQEHGVLTLTTPGYLTARGPLQIESDLVMAVGGSARIEHIRSTAQMPVRITIIASRGDVEVQRVSGPVALFVASRSMIDVPPTAFLPPFPFPVARTPTVQGIQPDD